jgi:regulator of nonsense transcripts 2
MVGVVAAQLPNCVNREMIDTAAAEFCMTHNTKINRRRLVKALFMVHRTRTDLLPFYARLVATLFPCMPDVATQLGALLKQDFRWAHSQPPSVGRVEDGALHVTGIHFKRWKD